MAEFLIKLADERGHVSQQVETARSEAEVRERYSQQGYHVYWVKSRGLLAGGQVPFPRRRRIKQAEFIIFNQQFLTLIRAGLPILHALDLLARRQRNQYFRSVLENVRERVKSGELLSEAFAEQGVLPKIYTTTLLAGEKSGNLEEVLNRYITYQRMALTFRKKLQSSLIYPALLVVMVVVMLSFLMAYVVPQFAKLFEQLNAELPQLTLMMLSIGKAVQKYFIAGLGAVALIFLLLWRWSRSDRGAQLIDRFKLRLPLFGDIWLKYQVAVLSRMLATLLSGGLPLVPALETAGASMESRLIANGITKAAQRVREGMPLARSLEETQSFPDLAVEMIEVGESTGALPAMLTSVAEFYEEDVQTALTAAMSLIEPAILIVMGTIVAFVLISLYLPIFTLGGGGLR
jgi:type IV pilus assembly protein PilC